jgi:hypothetical protein
MNIRLRNRISFAGIYKAGHIPVGGLRFFCVAGREYSNGVELCRQGCVYAAHPNQAHPCLLV